MRILLLTLFFTAFSQIISAQLVQKGIPFVKNYLPSDYNGDSQNWAIIEDDRGVMYFGNTKGLLEFDGSYWKLIDDINVFTAKKRDDGTIFVAGNQDYGYLETNSLGEVKFVSLKPLLPDNTNELNDFYSIEIANDKVYFGEHNGRIHIYDNSTIEVISTEFSSVQLAYVDDTFYISSKYGLYTLNGKTLTKAPNSEVLNGLNTVGLFNFKNQLLIVTRLNGLFLFDGQKTKAWNIKASNFLKSNQVYRATRVNNSQMAFGTVEDGMLLIDSIGTPIQHVNSKGGMINHDHCAIYTDSWGNIWSGLENGISHIQINSPFTIYNKQSGLNNSAIYSMQTHNNKLYIGTAQGIMYRNMENVNNPLASNWKFTYLGNNQARKAWDILEENGNLITSYSNRGVYRISENNSVHNIIKSNTPESFVSDSSNKYYVCKRQHGGLMVLKRMKGTIKEHKIIDKKQHVDYLAKDSFENYWAYLSNGELIKIKFSANYQEIITYEAISKPQELSKNSKIAPFNIGSALYFGTNNGTYIYKHNSNSFEKFHGIKTNHPNLFIYKTQKESDGNTYFLAKNYENDIIGIIKNESNGYSTKIISKPLRKISHLEIKSIFPIDTNMLLIGCIDRLVQYEENKQYQVNEDFNILIRSVKTITEHDSLIFGGAYTKNSTQVEPINLEFKENALRFKYAAIYYDEPEKSQYSHRLLGYESNWSDWTLKTEKEYSYLESGNYTFEVKAKNLYGDESQIASYSFYIAPPWYKTTLAYIIYIILLLIITRFIAKLSIRKVQNEKVKLEQMVALRTQQLSTQRDEILNKNKTLEDQQKELSYQHQELSTHRTKTLDSLKYAEHIQNSLLPKQKQYKTAFVDHFILYKPKDIVSGDFYWFKKTKTHTIFAVADCTGHGVPGAFMSVIGISFMNEIISQKKVSSPAKALEKLRTQIKTTLNPEVNQDKSENYIDLYLNSKIKDGMDVALCAIDNETSVLNYAGANLPIFIIRSNELIELKPTDNPVGVYLIEEPFVNETFQLIKGDMIYLFSDGYYDQFGGPENKKFFIQEFKRLLLKVNAETCEKQKEILNTTIENWQGVHEQIDDILVLGIRI